MMAAREAASRYAGGGKTAAIGAADWLCLAAAPTFAIMALLTGVRAGSTSEMLCSAAQDASPLNGMVVMYLLMSAFHLAPWLKLIVGRHRRDNVYLQHDPQLTYACLGEARARMARTSACSRPCP
jgi:hypothetical protein